MAKQNLTPTDILEQASPGNPPAGFLRLFAKSDKKPWVRDSTGVETDLTATGGGGGVSVPSIIATGATFTVPDNVQAAAALPITVDGNLLIEGSLVLL